MKLTAWPSFLGALVLLGCGPDSFQEHNTPSAPRDLVVSLHLPKVDRPNRLLSLVPFLGLTNSAASEAKSYLPFHVGLRITSADGVVRFANTLPLNGEELSLTLPHGPVRVQAVLLGEPLAQSTSKEIFCAANAPRFEGMFVARGEATVNIDDSTNTLPVSFASLQYAPFEPLLVRAAGANDTAATGVVFRTVDLLSGQPVLDVCQGKPLEKSTNAQGVATFALPLGANASQTLLGFSALNSGLTTAPSKTNAWPHPVALASTPYASFLQWDVSTGALLALSPKQDPLAADVSLEGLAARGLNLKNLLGLAHENGGSLANVWFAGRPLPTPSTTLTAQEELLSEGSRSFVCEVTQSTGAPKNLPRLEFAWSINNTVVPALLSSRVSEAEVIAAVGLSNTSRTLRCQARYVFVNAAGTRQEGAFSATQGEFSLQPFIEPTPEPTASATVTPTAFPTAFPTIFPTLTPTSTPTVAPTPVVSPSPLVNQPPSAPTMVTISGYSGTANITSSLLCTASGSTDPENDAISFEYSWARRQHMSDPFVLIAGATSATLSGAVAGRGHEVQCLALARDSFANVSGTAASAAVLIENRLPLVSGSFSHTAEQGTPYSFSLGISDPDGDPVTVSCTSGCASGIFLNFDNATGTANIGVGSPAIDTAGTLSFTIAANDGVQSTSKNITVFVDPAPPSTPQYQLQVDGMQPPLAEMPTNVSFLYKVPLKNAGSELLSITTMSNTFPAGVTVALNTTDPESTCHHSIVPGNTCTAVLEFFDTGTPGPRMGSVTLVAGSTDVNLSFDYDAKPAVTALYSGMEPFFAWGTLPNPAAGLAGQGSVEPCNPGTNTLTTCAHYGALRKFTVAGESLCSSHQAHDALGVFEWQCEIVGSDTLFVGQFKPGKGLRDVLDFSHTPPKHKGNRVIVSPVGSNATYAESAFMSFFNTPVEELTSSSAPIALNAGKIHVVKGPTLAMAGLSLSGNTALVTAPGATLETTGSASSCLATTVPVNGTSVSNPTCLVKVMGAFNWVETNLNLTTSTRHIGIAVVGQTSSVAAFNTIHSSSTKGGAHGLALAMGMLSESRHNVVQFSRFEQASDSGVYLKSATQVRLANVQLAKTNVGLHAESSSHVVTLRLTTSNTTLAGVILDNSTGNTLVQTTVSSSQAGFSVRGTSTNTVVSGLTAAFLTGPAIDLMGGVASLGITNVFVGNAPEAVRTSASLNICDNTAGTSPNASLMNLVTVSVPVTHKLCHGGATNVTYSGHVSSQAAPVCKDSSNSSCTTSPFSSGFSQFTTQSNTLETSVAGQLTLNEPSVTEAADIALSLGLPDTSISQWTGFAEPGRLWARFPDGTTFDDTSRQGPCSAEHCVPLDLRLKSNDALFASARFTDGVNTVSNGTTLASSGNCEAAAVPNTAQNSVTLSSVPMLRNAFEVLGDGKGNENGRCEAGETCVYMPHVGAFQGLGGLRKGTCTVPSGSFITGPILMRSYNFMVPQP